jgi:pimeloyl-ACP methyl ester carboxylesterase
MRELAGRLAQAGFHVLRFDYFGTGDSAGESEEAELPIWLEDIDTAVEEARELADTRAVSLVGLRLGATLAALWGSRNGELRQAVLWAPVVSGAHYLGELSQQHRAWFEVRPRPRDLVFADPPEELLGTPLRASLRQAIERIDLLGLERCPARRLLVIGPESAPGLGALRGRLAGLGCPAESLDQLGSSWTPGDFDQQPVPAQTLQAIVGWLSQTPA